MHTITLYFLLLACFRIGINHLLGQHFVTYRENARPIGWNACHRHTIEIELMTPVIIPRHMSYPLQVFALTDSSIFLNFITWITCQIEHID